MRPSRMITCLLMLATCAICLGAEDKPLDTAAIERATGLKGSLNQAEGVFKVSMPRTDVPVTVDGNALPPFMGLTSWAAFTAGGSSEAMVMGDLVLFQDEVDPVMSALLGAGLAVTALHNHFFWSDPPVYFMHIGGEGTAADLAKGVRAAFDAVAAVRAKAAKPPATSGREPLAKPSSIDPASLKTMLGVEGQAKDGMFKAVFARSAAMPCGCTVGAEMGVNTWAAFMGSMDRAVVDGDFATGPGELQPVLKALRAGGIGIVAIHSHMEGDAPHYLFLHYWGVGPAAELAKTVKAALDAQKAAATKAPGR